MESPWLIGLSRQVALKREMDVVAHNVANMNTPAFKAERVLFAEYLVQPQRNVPMSFVEDKAMLRDLTEGPLTKTGNPFDLAISGDGYFIVGTDAGERYSRSGRFQLDADGQMVNQLGHPVLSAAGQPIVIPPGTRDVSISPDGTVSADTEVVGAVGVVRFENPRELKREENNLYTAEEPAQPDGTSRVLQGMLEESNVNAVHEMTTMIDIHRAYASNQRLLQDEHDRIRRAIRVIAGSNGAQ